MSAGPELTALMESLLAQEDSLRFRAFDEDSSWELGSRIVRKAMAGNMPIAVDIRLGRRRLFHASRPGASADNGFWVERKSATVERFGHSSYYIGQLLASKEATLESKYKISSIEYSASGGSFPIIVKGVGPVGAATVSGLTQEEDHALVVATIGEMLAEGY